MSGRRSLAITLVLLAEGALIRSDRAEATRQQADTPIRCEFRAFDGEEEVTAETRIRVFPSGKREGGFTAEGASQAVMNLPPGIYDAQAIRQRQGQVVSVKWAERLVIMRYPDEGGQHLEVINFKPRYGALQLAGPLVEAQMFDVAAFPAGEPSDPATGAATTPVGRSVKGDGYLLIIVPTGRYDVRIRTADRTGRTAESARADQWIRDLEIPADRTRLRRISAQP